MNNHYHGTGYSLPAGMWDYRNIQQTYVAQQAMAAYHQNAHVGNWSAGAGLMNPKTTESKPRLAKEEVEQLEAEFQKNNKPNSNLKKGLAEQMRVEVARINNWFQNRRAKAKQERRTAAYEAMQREEKERAEPQISEFFGESNHSDTLRPSSAPLTAEPGTSTSSTSLAQSPTSSIGPDSIAKSIEAEDREEEGAAASTTHSSPSPATHASPDSLFGAGASEPRNQSYLVTDGLTGFASSSDNTSSSFFNGYAIPTFTTFDNSQSTNGQVQQGDLSSSFAQSSPQTVLRSPNLTIASRRNAPRPAPLGANALQHRIHIPQGPRTVDGSRIYDRPGGNMRRVSSASGSVRIHKAVSAGPLSQYVDRKPELLQQMAQLPNKVVSPTPPTPATPALVGQQQPAVWEATAISTSSDEDAYSPASIFAANAAPSTPPTTPSVITNMPQIYFDPAVPGFCYDAAFGSGADFGTVPSLHAMPNSYSASQPVTPFDPQRAAGSMAMASYPLYPMANDYGWPHVGSAQSPLGVPSHDPFAATFGGFDGATTGEY